MQHVAVFNFLYGALTGNDCEADLATQHLRMAVDLANYSFRNSTARTSPTAPATCVHGGNRAMSPRETGPNGEVAPRLGTTRGAGKGVTPPIAGWRLLDGGITASSKRPPPGCRADHVEPRLNKPHGTAPYAVRPAHPPSGEN